MGSMRYCVYSYALAVFVASTIGAFIGNAEAAILVGLPLSMVYAGVHIVVFALLRFDLTDQAPLWQDIITGLALVVGLTMAAFVQAAWVAFVANAIAEQCRRRDRRGAPDPASTPRAW